MSPNDGLVIAVVTTLTLPLIYVAVHAGIWVWEQLRPHVLYRVPGSHDEWRCTCERWTVSGPGAETRARLRHPQHRRNPNVP